MYAKITYKDHQGRQQTRRIPLPFAVGSSPLCDVVIRSKAIAPCLFVAQTDTKGQLNLIEASSQTSFPRGRLLHYKLSINGPYCGNPEKLSIKTRLLEWLTWEKQLGNSLSQFSKTLLGYRLPQLPRLIMQLAFVGALIIYSGRALDNPSEAQPTAQPKSALLTFGTPLSTSFQSSGANDPLSKGFDLTLILDGNNLEPEFLIMEFRTKGIGADRGLIVQWNGVDIWASKARPECLTIYCTERLEIPNDKLATGLNTITFHHLDPDQPFEVDSLFVTAIRQLSAFEKAALEHHLKVAQRFYDERHIVHSNLIRARAELETIDRLLVGVTDQEAQRAAAKHLRNSVETDFEAVVGDLTFRIEQAARLTKYNEAIALGDHLLTLYPNADGAAYQNIKRYLDQLRRRL